MSFPKYEVYKDSEIEWFDVLPSHWNIISLRWVSNIFAGGTPDKKNLDFWTDGSIPWLNSGSVNQGLITEPSNFITTDAYRCSSAKWIPKGALVIALAGQGKTKGMVAQLAITATCNQSMAAIVPNEAASARYVYWWLTHNYQNIRNLAGGDLRDGLNLKMIGSVSTPIPPAEEQIQISRFLDRETARIDALIAEQQRLIELLKEKRQAVISHAVTKGIDRTVPMKDSGVEWLGEVPEHWRVIKLARILRTVEQGWSPNASSEPAEIDKWGVIKISAVKKGIFVEAENKALLEDTLPDKTIKVRKGDLLVTRANTPDLVGDVCLVERTPDSHLMLSDLTYRLQLKSDIDGKFICFFLLSSFGRAQIKGDARGSSMSMAKISQGHIKGWIISLPEYDEQLKITEYLSVELKKINCLMETSNETKQLLQERRSALISAAVTGKIDVRNWQPSPETSSPVKRTSKGTL